MDELTIKTMVYGYSSARPDSRSGKQDNDVLTKAGAKTLIYGEASSVKSVCPALKELFGQMKTGDSLVIRDLSVISRSRETCAAFIRNLIGKGCSLNVLSIGNLTDSATAGLVINTLLNFPGKSHKSDMPETHRRIIGRPATYTDEDIRHALALLEEYSYTQVVSMTGISKASLCRYRRVNYPDP